ncbi:hypothetical protein [Paenibacillus turpanensis]|nr:hypothetical protein [Paenibacillus turpanensis]
MIDQDEHFGSEAMSMGRGMVYGLLFGGLFWAGIIGGVLYLIWK